MSLIKLTKADLSKELGEKILFFHIAEGGAMGEPGESFSSQTTTTPTLSTICLEI